MPDDNKPSEYEQKLWNYIASIEATNDSLLETLKQCAKTMMKEKDYVSDPIEWNMWAGLLEVYIVTASLIFSLGIRVISSTLLRG